MVNQRLSLVIPRVFPQWVDEGKMIKIFRDQQIGIISKVSIVSMPKEKGRKHPIYKAYLYFSVWFENIISQNFQDRIYGKARQARVVYDDPWYWTVFENTECLKLSKEDKRLMRVSAEIYKNSLFVQEQQEQQEQIAHEQAEQKQQLDQQKQQLAEQNNIIQILQDFCIKNGLEVPFWSAKHPPSAEVSSLEALSAATAVACADFVLQDEEQSDDKSMPNYYIPYECAEAVLSEDSGEVDSGEVDSGEIDTLALDKEFGENFNYDFIPVKRYEGVWETENPYIPDTPEQSQLLSYLAGDL